MRLELKYLAGYLPYGLKFKTNFDHIQYLMTSLDINKSKVTFKAINNFKNSKNISIKLLGENKPILRPLSDLKKEIEVNGKKFVPIYNLTKMFDLHESYELRFENNLFLLWDKKNKWYRINDNNFILFQKLFEWHFDIYGLIDAGLAIDINTLNK
jgi:hypothetical protein